MRRYIPSIVALLIPTIAAAADPAADKPVIGPAPAWVRPAALPADTAKPDESAVKLLLSDQQMMLLPNGSETYTETAVRVQTAQGLNALGTITLTWKPDLGTLTVHKLHIIRDGKVIDLLAGGPGFTVVRRENNLDYAMLDGILTAVIQPEGLQVGDILDMASTVKARDPVLGGNSEAFFMAGAGTRAAHLQMRAQWPSTLPVRWREGDGLPAARERKAGGMTEVSLAADNFEPLILPKGAPARFAMTRMLETSTFRSWDQLSALFAPLYAKAATLKPDSPLKAEIARIAAASPDPARRAEAALALVQDRIRYVFLGMNDGNLVPADADLTWQRRFADCKGKTAILLALLHGVGIEAEPAIVSTRIGDGMDERLPMAGLFDHVIVRATIGGKVYWLDGTRTGDVRLADIQVPNFRFALPLRTQGGTLEPLAVPVPAKPLVEYSFTVDMRGGIMRPFPFHVEEVTRGDAALGAHLALDNLTAQVRQQTLRDYFVGQYDDVDPQTVSAAWDPATGEEKLVMDGLANHDWKWSYEADRSRVGWSADFSRTEGVHRDAPFAVDYPDYVRTRETILLPNGGKGFVDPSPDLDRTIAGVEYHRTSKLDGATYVMEMTRRALVREFPAADAPAAQEGLKALSKQQALLGVTPAYQPTQQELAAILSSNPQTALDYSRRAIARAQSKDDKGALADLDRAIELDPSLGLAYLARGSLLGKTGQLDRAEIDLQKAVVMVPQSADTHSAYGWLLAERGKPAEGLAELNRALVLSPDNPRLLATRADIQRQLGHDEQALVDSAAALKAIPGNVELYQLRVNAYMALGQADKALAEAQAAVAADPKNDFAHVLLAATYARLHRQDEALAEFSRAIALKPTPYAYLTRANARPLSDIAGRRTDIAAALRLDPDQPDARRMSATLELRAKNYPAVITAANAGLARQPKDAAMLWNRGAAYAESGHGTEAEKDFAAARDAAATNPQYLNSMCWEKATLNVALPSALADCDASLRIAPDAANTVDSRGFVLFRMARYPEAVEAYDQALKLRPKSAESLYMRGLAKRHLGKTAEGDGDVSAAKAIDAKVDKEFADYGVTG